MDSPTLDRLRQEIDSIDSDLHGLIERRADLVDRIAASKKGGGGLALRPGREAQVMRKRLAGHRGPFPAAAVWRMWREMMCAFTLMQTPDIKIAICRPIDQPGYWDLARDHFGCQIPLVAHDTPAQVLAAVRASPTTLGVVPAPIEADTTPWWPLLTGRDASLPNVVVRLPFLMMPNARARGISAFVLARMEPEESGDDRALIALEAETGLSRNRIAGALEKAGLPAFTSALDQVVGGVHHYLVELPGLVTDSDPRLGALGAALGLQNGRVAAIGAYAAPALVRA
ncbi:chorismate mutase [Reyranella sp.]|uniref:chorismate mutase n=1 Tax=Reyranella sp. TaxID=1929291 RepID=UPI003782F0BD